MNLENFIEQSNLLTDKQELFELYTKAINELNFDKIVYSFMTDHNSIAQKAGHAVMSNYPHEWIQHYQENSYHQIDPVVYTGMNKCGAFTWESLENTMCLNKKQKLFMREAEDIGLLHGVGIPLHRTIGEIAGVGLASSTHFMITKDMLSKIRCITEQFHHVYCELSQENLIQNKPIHLTNKECEVLKWMANGKSNSDIADILHVSTSTIKFHQQNIYTKLSANDRVLAVTKAIHMKLIPLDTIGIRTIFD